MILDTNAISAILAGDPAIKGVLDNARVLVVPAIVMGEYRYGITGSRLKEELSAGFDRLMEQVQCAPVDEPVTRQYAQLRRSLKEAGTPLPENDVWIAATARHYGMPVLSLDVHFDVVPGIKRIGW